MMVKPEFINRKSAQVTNIHTRTIFSPTPKLWYVVNLPKIESHTKFHQPNHWPSCFPLLLLKWKITQPPLVTLEADLGVKANDLVNKILHRIIFLVDPQHIKVWALVKKLSLCGCLWLGHSFCKEDFISFQKIQYKWMWFNCVIKMSRFFIYY